MRTDWFVKVDCPRPRRNISSEEDENERCPNCPYVIWEKPQKVLGFMYSMCGVRVGCIIDEEIDEIGKKVTGIEKFTKEDSNPALKRNILEKIKAYAKENDWTISCLSQRKTLEHINNLIKFCKRAQAKGLEIWVLK